LYNFTNINKNAIKRAVPRAAGGQNITVLKIIYIVYITDNSVQGFVDSIVKRKNTSFGVIIYCNVTVINHKMTFFFF